MSAPLPDGYTGWVLITTPQGRRKVRWVQDGRVWRDDHRKEGGRHTVSFHSLSCTITPALVARLVTAATSPTQARISPVPAPE